MTEQIWAMSTGSYSDYSVDAIFARKEDAEATVASLNEEPFMEYSVEELDFYRERPQVYVGWRWAFYWYTPTAGRLTVPEPREATLRRLGESYPARPEAHEDRMPSSYGLTVEGADREAVRKAFFDRYETWRATMALVQP